MTTSVEAAGSLPQRGGTPWGKSFPRHWDAVPLFSTLRERQFKNKGNFETNVLSLSYGRIIRRDVESNHGLLPDSFETYQIVKPGNIVLRLTDLQNDQRSLRVGLAGEQGIITSAYLCLEGYNGIEPKYSFYLLHSYDLNKVFYSLGGGVRQSLKFDELRWLTLPLPPLDEQRAIIAFLDRETAHLDGLIERKNRLLELMEEQRRAVISQAVTRGLNSDAPLKDSGVHWLGQVPQHWEVKPLKSLSRMYGGGTPAKDKLEFWDGEIPWVSPKDMKSPKIISSEDRITDAGLRDSAAKLVPAGSLLMVFRSGILQRTIPVAINQVPVTLNQDMKAFITSDPLRPEYLIRIFEGYANELLPVLTKVGATVESLDSSLVGSLTVPIPSNEEQQAIAAYLDIETAKLDVLRQKLEQSIAHLREYRAALITAAVTGQIDVREETTQA